MLPAQSRPVAPRHFEVTSHAVLTRTRLKILHHNRGRNETLEREVSPQRLVHYRDNWYLDAWCHLRDGLRCFALESIREATLLDTTARNVPETTLDEELGSSYGIFTGKADKIAKLRFTPERARWVAGEIWHPKQKSYFDDDGCYILEIPYRDDRELVMDVLKHGPEVEVLGPESLCARISELRIKAVRQCHKN
jgi:predicted DNA-binding transcriptional regulator YafY